MTVEAIQELAIQAADRLRAALPGIDDIILHPAATGLFAIGFTLNDVHHTFRLKREAGIWRCSEWQLEGLMQRYDNRLQSPRFEALLAELLNLTESTPKVRVVELRCPDDSRRMFAKLILQDTRESPHKASKALIEFSCSQCKRATGHVTKHYFAADGQLLKTQLMEPWVKEERGAWYSTPDAATSLGQQAEIKAVA